MLTSLIGCPQKYDWGVTGDTSLVSHVHDRNLNSIPKDAKLKPDFIIDPKETYAELWYGDHPNGPNFVYCHESNCIMPLTEFMGSLRGGTETGTAQGKDSPNAQTASTTTSEDAAQIKEVELSSPTEEETAKDEDPSSTVATDTPVGNSSLHSAVASTDITYLFKLLSIAKPLSIQLHPRLSKAKELHQTCPDTYKDPEEKVECAIAISEKFEALCGFRKYKDIQKISQIIPAMGEFLRPSSAVEASGGTEEGATTHRQQGNKLGGLFGRKAESSEHRGLKNMLQKIFATPDDEFKKLVDSVLELELDLGTVKCEFSSSAEKKPDFILEMEKVDEADTTEGSAPKETTHAESAEAVTVTKAGEDSEHEDPGITGRTSVNKKKNTGPPAIFGKMTRAMSSIIGKKSEKSMDADDLLQCLELFKQLHAEHPYDKGLFAAFYLNYISMRPGECLLVPPDTLHAYIKGDCFECMRKSDNVIRAGLTNKQKDPVKLMECMDCHGTTVQNLLIKPTRVSCKFEPSSDSSRCMQYDIQAGAFKVMILFASPGVTVSHIPLPKGSPIVTLCVSGSGVIKQSLESKEAREVRASPGQSFLLFTNSHSPISIHNDAEALPQTEKKRNTGSIVSLLSMRQPPARPANAADLPDREEILNSLTITEGPSKAKDLIFVFAFGSEVHHSLLR